MARGVGCGVGCGAVHGVARGVARGMVRAHRAVLGTLGVDQQVGRVRVTLEVAVCEELHGPGLATARYEELAVNTRPPQCTAVLETVALAEAHHQHAARRERTHHRGHARHDARAAHVGRDLHEVGGLQAEVELGRVHLGSKAIASMARVSMARVSRAIVELGREHLRRLGHHTPRVDGRLQPEEPRGEALALLQVLRHEGRHLGVLYLEHDTLARDQARRVHLAGIRFGAGCGGAGRLGRRGLGYSELGLAPLR
mgnify:CR=1 FL=1